MRLSIPVLAHRLQLSSVMLCARDAQSMVTASYSCSQQHLL